MNDDIDRLLNHVKSPDLPPELRQRVLAAVDRELVSSGPASSSVVPRPRRRRFRPDLAAAGLLLASLMLNQVVNTTVDRRLAAVLGPRPIPKQAAEIAADIAELTDFRTGAWAFDRLTAPREADGDTQLYLRRLEQSLDQLAAETQKGTDETSQGDREMDRDRHGHFDRLPAGAQRAFRLEHRNTA